MGRSRSRGTTRRDQRSPNAPRGAAERRSPRRGKDAADSPRRGGVKEWSRSPPRGGSKGSRDEPPAKPGRAAPKAPTAKKVRKDIISKELGYKDESNPFGDAGLTDKFVWKKKNEYLAAAGLYRPSNKDQDVDRIQSKILEIHQVKKRRDEREVERKLLETQRQEHDRDRHDEEFEEWEKKEEQFHLENAKARSLIRIEQGRERPIDLVAKGLAIAGGEEFEDMTILEKPPHQLFVPMTLDEVEDVVGDIENFVRNDKGHKAFWKAMLYVCQDALDTKQREKVGASRPGCALSGLGAGVAEGVVSEIHELLCSKDRDELEDMLIEIKGNLSVSKGDAGVDTQFFDAVATKIPLYIARAEIEGWHNKARKIADAWTEANTQDATEMGISMVTETHDKAKSSADAGGEWDDLPDGVPEGDDLSPELEPLDVLEEADNFDVKVKGAYSPVLEPISSYDPQDLLDPGEDERILRQVRQTLIEAFCGPISSGSRDDGLDRSKDDELLRQEKAKGFGDGEVGFNAAGKGQGDDFHGEFELAKKSYEWEDKYRPRKPRFFNRVKTGYEWNKYNQTHYDHDNPPPKMVQGYKFNVFYPDLINKTAAPTYYIEKDPASDETVLLRFHAGPPYEDCAFKIVCREWNLSHRFGFRVVFDRGVLQLYFNFKRWRYRR